MRRAGPPVSPPSAPGPAPREGRHLFAVVEAMLAEGLLPDVISSDLHPRSIPWAAWLTETEDYVRPTIEGPPNADQRS